MSKQTVRIGILGGGFGSAFQWHLHPQCEVGAVCDARQDRREHLVGTYGAEVAYEDFEELLQDTALGAVAVFSGAPAHADQAIAVMESGKHCISAVPAAMTLEDCRRLIEAKERTGLRYMMAETSYYRWETMLMRELYEGGDFGEVIYSEVEYYHPIYQGHAERDVYWWDSEGKPTWRHGYPPLLYPTHSTGFIVGVTRERITSVSALGHGAADDPFLGEEANQYANPFSSQAALCLTDKGNISRCNVMFGINAHGERAQWFGERAAAYMPGCAGQPFVVRIEGRDDITELPDYWQRLPEPMREGAGHGNSHPFLTNEFVSALLEDREPAADVYESVAMTAPGIVAHQSALQSGEKMDVPSFDP